MRQLKDSKNFDGAESVVVTSFSVAAVALLRLILREVQSSERVAKSKDLVLPFLTSTPSEIQRSHKGCRVIHFSRNYEEVAADFLNKHSDTNELSSAITRVKIPHSESGPDPVQALITDVIDFDISWRLNPFDNKILYLSYEDLRDQPVVVLRKIQKFLGVEWNDRDLMKVLAELNFGFRRYIGAGFSPKLYSKSIKLLRAFRDGTKRQISNVGNKKTFEDFDTGQVDVRESYRNLILNNKHLVKKRVDGFSWTLDVSDKGIGRILAKSNSTGSGLDFAREKLFMHILDTVVKPGMTCIDIGANIGYATMIMARNSGDSRKVFALEPDEHNLAFLKANLLTNGFGNCHVSQRLISDVDGQRDFWIAAQPNLNSVIRTKHSIRKQILPCITLRTLCMREDIYPNFLKMDIEGHEVSVLQGAFEFFRSETGETHFLLEVHPALYSKDNDFAEVLHQYEEIGFRITKLVATPESNPAPFRKLGYTPSIEVESDGRVRSLYTDVNNADAIRLCTQMFDDVQGGKVVRAILLSREALSESQ